MPSSFNSSFGTTVRASHIKQIINAWQGVASAGVPLALTSVNSNSAYAATIRNLGTGGALRVQNAAGSDLLVVNESGVTLSASLSSVTSLTLTQGTITSDLNVLSATSTWNSAGVTFTAWELNVTDTASAAGSLLIDLQVGGTTQFNVTKAGAVTTVGAISPSANDGAALGSATVSWADLFLASGGIINFANGDVTITHATDL